MSIETVFIGVGGLSAKELHCQMDDNNHVSWQEVPVGEKGDSIRFDTPEQALNFMGSNARILGYARKEAGINGGL